MNYIIKYILEINNLTALDYLVVSLFICLVRLIDFSFAIIKDLNGSFEMTRATVSSSAFFICFKVNWISSFFGYSLASSQINENTNVWKYHWIKYFYFLKNSKNFWRSTRTCCERLLEIFRFFRLYLFKNQQFRTIFHHILISLHQFGFISHFINAIDNNRKARNSIVSKFNFTKSVAWIDVHCDPQQNRTKRIQCVSMHLYNKNWVKSAKSWERKLAVYKV